MRIIRAFLSLASRQYTLSHEIRMHFSNVLTVYWKAEMLSTNRILDSIKTILGVIFIVRKFLFLAYLPYRRSRP